MRWTVHLHLRDVFGALLSAVICLSAHGQVVTWSGTGDWSNVLNWSPGLPGLTETAQISSGTATVSDARSVGAIALSGGTIAGAGTLTLVATGSTWSGGTLNGSAG